jgi:pimeloyl-ACP methyl ester carboxylesterase
MAAAEERERVVTSADGLALAVRETGPEDGRPVLALHGVLQTRDNVLKAADLARAGYRVIAPDVRGHGRSEGTTDPDDYGYDALLRDVVAVQDAYEASPAVMVGVSIGGVTALRLAIEQPERVAGLVVATPAFDPSTHPIPADLERAARVAAAVRAGDAGALIDAEPVPVDDPDLYRSLRVFAERTAQRTVQAHRDREVAAVALEAILRARAFESLDELAAVRAPTVVVGSRDKYDGNHPHHVARAYAEAIPGARFLIEDEGKLPLAWRGREMTRIALEMCERARWGAGERDAAPALD